jgi:hypothetical protein
MIFSVSRFWIHDPRPTAKLERDRWATAGLPPTDIDIAVGEHTIPAWGLSRGRLCAA